MAFKTDISQLKLAEKLVILNDRSLGILTRIYNMKKACGDAKSRPSFFNDKSLDSAISYIAKKFPVIDLKRNSSAFISVNDMRAEIIQNLSLYYYTFVDLLDLKDHILRMLTTMDANQCQLDITLNYDLTAGYLNLVANYMCIMILLSRVDDRKIVLGLFNAAYDFVNNGSETSFPRLGQMIIDYENPLKKLCEDLGPLSRLIQSALTSLRDIYFRRNISADDLREAAMLSLISNPKQILYAAQTNTIACEYLSLDIMDRWIIFGVTVCHSQLLSDTILAPMYNRALHHGVALRLFRDESILVFPTVLNLFETVKGYNKKVQEMKELSLVSLQTCGSLHAHRRQFLRSALRELCFLIRDQPGLLGPKILFVWMGLSFARDEIVWILRHADIWPLVNVHKKTKVLLNNVVNDKYLPELLFYVVELRLLVLKHSSIISKYYAEYVNGYDAVLLQELAGNLKNLSSRDELLVHSFVESISNIKDNHSSSNAGAVVDLRGVRLDWFRLQAGASVGRSAFRLQDYTRFAIEMNTTIFHLKMIDVIDEMLRETSDLSIYCFYPQLFDAQLKQCLNFPAQSRYALVFAMIASNFVNSLHEMCPEEKHHIVQKGLLSCNGVLEDLTKRTTEVLTQMAEDELQLGENTSPQNCAKLLSIAFYQQQQSTGKHQNVAPPALDTRMPGRESIRSGVAVTNADKNYLYLVELCQAIGVYKEIHMSDYTFVPREFLAQSLERNLHTVLLQHLRTASTSAEISPNDNGHLRRPSEMLCFLRAQLIVLQSVDSCLSFNVARLFNDALLQQSQGQDAQGVETMAAVYSRWYLEVLLRRASMGHLIYSDHFQAYLSNSESAGSANFAAERYTDARELRALAQLIGAYGIKFMAERLTWHVACQITELYKIIREYRETLHTARVNFDKPEKLREVVTLLNLPASELSGTGGKERRLTVATVAAAASSAANASSAVSPTSSSNAFSSAAAAATAAATAAVAAAAASAPTGASGAVSGSPLESLLQRVTIIGEILAFRDLLFRSLHDVLEEKMPFLISSMNDLIETSDEMQKIAIGDMCAAAGVRADIDLALVNAVQAQAQAHKLHDPDEHYNLSCLLFVFIAIALPKLAVSRQSVFKATFVASQNNCHTIPLAVNTLAGALFFYHRRNDVHERMREFLALASSGLLQIVGTTGAGQMQQYRSVYILLERLVHRSPWLNFGLLESCFPYTLLRCAYLNCYRQEETHNQQQLMTESGNAGNSSNKTVGTALFTVSTTIMTAQGAAGAAANF